jgi:hypothetical protein
VLKFEPASLEASTYADTSTVDKTPSQGSAKVLKLGEENLATDYADERGLRGEVFTAENTKNSKKEIDLCDPCVLCGE